MHQFFDKLSSYQNDNLIQRVAKAPRSRGDPFLPAAQDRNPSPLVSPFSTKLSAEPRTRRKAARTLSALYFPVCVPSIRACRLDGTFSTVWTPLSQRERGVLAYRKSVQPSGRRRGFSVGEGKRIFSRFIFTEIIQVHGAPGNGRFFVPPSQALRASSPTGGAKCTPVNREILCGKINVSAALPYHKLCRD